MDPETLFSFFNNGVLPAWILLAVAPDWRWTQRIVHAFWIPLLLGCAYLLAILNGIGQGPEGANFFSLEGVMLLFHNPWSALAGWVHFLAFDLFVGAWEVRDARRHQIAHGWVIVCLGFTLMTGPFGLALYAVLRIMTTNGFSLTESVPITQAKLTS